MMLLRNIAAALVLAGVTMAQARVTMESAKDSLRQPKIERLRQAMRVVRDREGYDLPLDVADVGVLRDAAPAIDLTAAILRELRKPVADAQRHR